MKMELEDVAKLLTEYNHFVITAHVNPDGDAVGSLLALMHGLKALNKQVTCLIDDEIPRNFEIMPGYEMIARPQEAIVNADLLIILDCSDLERIGKTSEVVNAPILNIDHHISNNGFADYLHLDANSAATGEIIFRLLKQLKVEITKSMAICLYTAIATDCGFFRYANTSAETMQIGAELLACGVKPNIISENLEKKSLTALQTLGKVLDSLELFAQGHISCITITSEIVEECDSTEGFIDFARIVEGVDVAIMVKYIDEKTCRISMRSKQTDVSKVALQFSGGGHVRAAGCTLNLPLAEAKQTIIAAVQAAMEDMRHE